MAMRLYWRAMTNRPISMRAVVGWVAALIGAWQPIEKLAGPLV